MKYFVSICLVVLSLGIYFIYKTDYTELNPIQKLLAEKIYKKWDNKINSYPKDERVTVDYENLLSELSLFERMLVADIFSIDPKELGFKGPFYSKEKPGRLVKLSSVRLNVNGKEIETGVQFYPEHAYRDFENMISQMKKETGKTLHICSGYRSPGRQAYLFFKYLVTSSKFSLEENARWIAMPGYSEHGSPVNTSVDLENEDGINGIDKGQSPEDFEKLPEYKWLLENAARYNFYLTYPRNNQFGVAFEPWHWHWERK